MICIFFCINAQHTGFMAFLIGSWWMSDSLVAGITAVTANWLFFLGVNKCFIVGHKSTDTQEIYKNRIVMIWTCHSCFYLVSSRVVQLIRHIIIPCDLVQVCVCTHPPTSILHLLLDKLQLCLSVHWVFSKFMSKTNLFMNKFEQVYWTSFFLHVFVIWLVSVKSALSL